MGWSPSTSMFFHQRYQPLSLRLWQSALSQNNMQATLPSGRSTEQDVAVEQAVQRETNAIVTSNAGTESLQPIIENSDPKPTQVFTSLAVSLASRVSAKLKAKIWANEYVDFGSLLFPSPQNEGKYYLSVTPSGSSNHPQVTLEPCHPTKPNPQYSAVGFRL